MKNKAFILLAVVIAMLLQACKKDTSPQPYPEGKKGWVIGKKNGKNWSTSRYDAVYGKNNTVGFESEYPLNPSLKEYIVINNISYDRRYNKIHEYIYSPPSGKYDSTHIFYYLEAGGDASVGEYRILGNEENYITVDYYDADAREIRGSFRMTLCNGDYSDTIRFTECYYGLKIK